MKPQNYSIFLFIIFFSCDSLPPLTKEKYIKNYIEFINEVEYNNSSFTEEIWVEKDSLFQKYSKVYFTKFEKKLTSRDKDIIWKLNGKYIGIRAKNASKEIINQLEESMKEIFMGIEGFFEVFENDSVW